MTLFSQRDPAYQWQKLPLSDLSVHNDGCFLCSIATLGQSDPVKLMNTPGGFVKGGLLVPGVLAQACGMAYVGPSATAPKGWCIGRTADYEAKGYPTHFLLVNMDTRQMVDPLKYPATVEPLTYSINQFRIFSGVKFASQPPAPAFEAPGEPPIPYWAFGVPEKARKAEITTPLTQTIGDMPLYQLLKIVDKYLSA